MAFRLVFQSEKRPEAKIQVGDKAFCVKAAIIDSEERTRLYEKFRAASSNFVKYERNTHRVIPVVRLTPTNNNT